MADTEIDLSEDCCSQLLEEGAQSHQSLMHESRANGQSVHSIVRHAGARKYNQEDPIEAAAVEKILKV